MGEGITRRDYMMSGYATYILGSYGLVGVSMLIAFLWVKNQRRRTLKRLDQWFKRELH